MFSLEFLKISVQYHVLNHDIAQPLMGSLSPGWSRMAGTGGGKDEALVTKWKNLAGFFVSLD